MLGGTKATPSNSGQEKQHPAKYMHFEAVSLLWANYHKGAVHAAAMLTAVASQLAHSCVANVDACALQRPDRNQEQKLSQGKQVRIVQG